jgi:hypothetical protein
MNTFARRRERRQHRLLHLGPQLQVLSSKLGERIGRAIGRTHGPVHLLLHEFLLADECLDTFLEVAAEIALHRVAIKPDHRLEQRGRKNRAAELFLIGDHLQQHEARDVLIALVLDHLHARARDHHVADVVDRDVTTLRGVV